MNIENYRKDFPLLATRSHNKSFVYLDNAATSAKPVQVIEAERRYYEDFGVNIHRGLYEHSAKATRLFQETREKVARFINAADSRSIIFTHGSTESSNLVATSWGKVFLKAGDAVLTTELEHHSTLVPWQNVCEKTGAKLKFIPYNKETGELDCSSLPDLLQNVKVVVINGMTNATGYMPPVTTIIESAHEHGALVVLDGAQWVSHKPVDVTQLDVDFMYFSAHKMLGPTGLGVLYAKLPLLDAMEPYMFGGDMIDQVWADRSTWAKVPEKFEAGTPNIAGVLGFSAAIDYLETVGMEHVSEQEARLLAYALNKAEKSTGITVYGSLDRTKQGGIFSFNLEGIHSHDLGTILDACGVAIRTGFHCAMPYMNLLGVAGTARASFAFYNTLGDIDRLFEGILQARSVFG